MSVDDTPDDDSDSTPERFSQERKDDQIIFAEQAHQLLMDFWDCSPSSVHSVETVLDADYTTVEEGALVQALDFHCIDLMVEKPKQLIPLAQRFRPWAATQGQPDFSIRSDTGTMHHAEHELLSHSFMNGGMMPEYYSFGIHNNRWLTDHYIIDVNELYESVFDGAIEYAGPYRSPGGTRAVYFDIDDMIDNDCVAKHYGKNEIETIVEDNE